MNSIHNSTSATLSKKIVGIFTDLKVGNPRPDIVVGTQINDKICRDRTPTFLVGIISVPTSDVSSKTISQDTLSQITPSLCVKVYASGCLSSFTLQNDLVQCHVQQFPKVVLGYANRLIMKINFNYREIRVKSFPFKVTSLFLP